MDIEGFVRGRLTKGEDEEELKSILAERIREFKDISDEHSLLMAESVIDEVKQKYKCPICSGSKCSR